MKNLNFFLPKKHLDKSRLVQVTQIIKTAYSKKELQKEKIRKKYPQAESEKQCICKLCTELSTLSTNEITKFIFEFCFFKRTSVLWIVIQGRKKGRKCRRNKIIKIVWKLSLRQKQNQELLHNEYKLWYNVYTIIQGKDDEYEFYYCW